MLLKPIWILSFLLAYLPVTTDISTGKEKIQWMTLEEASKKMEASPKPMIIDLYAKWCYWCKEMDKKTYNNDKVVRYINENFYPVKMDAETKSTVQWNDREFDYNTSVRVNEFSLFVTNGQLSYPTTVIFMNQDEAPATIPGFMSSEAIEPFLKYFGEHYYKKTSFQDFLRSFKKSW